MGRTTFFLVNKFKQTLQPIVFPHASSTNDDD